MVIVSNVAFCENLRRTRFHKLSPASFAVAVVPILPVARIFPERQNCSACPFRVVDAPITHIKLKLPRQRPQFVLQET
jgi:hypothetical protein